MTAYRERNLASIRASGQTAAGRPGASGARSVVERAVRERLATLPDEQRLVLAISGGCDSMVLLEAVRRVAPERVSCVATFDHRTGEAARRATAHVVARARALGFAVERGRAPRAMHGENAWRDARWEFLRDVAARAGAAVATAHTRDDHLETVLMRALRGAGARGLSALAAPSPVVRPLLAVTRADVRTYAAQRGVTWIEDPTNADRRHLRNRVRLDLLPTLLRADPALPAALLALADRATAWRAELDALLDAHVRASVRSGALAVARAELAGYDGRSLCIVWPALAARAGIRLDRRGTRRLARFTIKGRNGARVPLSGGFVAQLHRDLLSVERWHPPAVSAHPVALRSGVRIGQFQFSMAPHESLNGDLWAAALPARQPDAPLTVRSWLPGDRMTPSGARAPRRVKGVLRDAGIAAAMRPGWPVVLAGEEIVWVPGVRRSDAATVRPGRPLVRFRCERLD